MLSSGRSCRAEKEVQVLTFHEAICSSNNSNTGFVFSSHPSLGLFWKLRSALLIMSSDNNEYQQYSYLNQYRQTYGSGGTSVFSSLRFHRTVPHAFILLPQNSESNMHCVSYSSQIFLLLVLNKHPPLLSSDILPVRRRICSNS